MRAPLILALILAASLAATAARAADDSCALIVRKSGATTEEERATTNLSVSAMVRSGQGVHADPVAGYDIVGFACNRDDIVPTSDDVKVLSAGFKLVLRLPGGAASSTWTRGTSGVDLSITGRSETLTPDTRRRLMQRVQEFSLQFAERRTVAASPVPPGPPPARDTCGIVIVPEAGGHDEERAVANFSVIETTKPDEGRFSIPAIPGYKLVGFVCDRDDIVPVFNDIKVLMVGYRLYIRVPARHQKAVLYMYGPRLRFAPIEGELTPEEDARVGPRIGEFMQYNLPPGGTWSHTDIAQ